jgi:hypothetical protein
MLERYFRAPKTLKRLRSGLSGSYMDGFAAALERDEYSHGIAVRYLRMAAHLGYFLQEQGKAIADIDSTTPETFFRHLPTCCCLLSNGEGRNHHPYFGQSVTVTTCCKFAFAIPGWSQTFGILSRQS